MIDMTISQRILAAVADAGSPRFRNHYGSTLEEVQSLLSEGFVEEAGWALVIHGNLHRGDRRGLARALPAIVSNRFWAGHLGLAHDQIARWQDAASGWAETVRRSAVQPERFAVVVYAQAARIASTTVC